MTVFENVYKLFGTVGAAFEITAILTAIVLTFLVRVAVASQRVRPLSDTSDHPNILSLCSGSGSL